MLHVPPMTDVGVRASFLSEAQMQKVLYIIFMWCTISNALPCYAVEAGLEKPAREATEKGWRYFKIGDLDTALKRFRQATILDPDFAPSYYGVGYVYSI